MIRKQKQIIFRYNIVSEFHRSFPFYSQMRKTDSTAGKPICFEVIHMSECPSSFHLRFETVSIQSYFVFPSWYSLLHTFKKNSNTSGAEKGNCFLRTLLTATPLWRRQNQTRDLGVGKGNCRTLRTATFALRTTIPGQCFRGYQKALVSTKFSISTWNPQKTSLL